MQDRCVLLQTSNEALFQGDKKCSETSNSDLYKQLSSSVENYAWERFRVLHSDFYLYSKTGNLFVL